VRGGGGDRVAMMRHLWPSRSGHAPWHDKKDGKEERDNTRNMHKIGANRIVRGTNLPSRPLVAQQAVRNAKNTKIQKY
jgi:hypothetical protein